MIGISAQISYYLFSSQSFRGGRFLPTWNRI